MVTYTKNIKNKHSSSRKKSRKFFVAGSIVVVVLLVAGSLLFLTRHKNPPLPVGIAGESKVNYGPPTKEEQAAGDDQKEQVVKQQELDKSKPTEAPTGTAAVTITDASYYPNDNTVEVRGYVSSVFEDGGTCTATFTQGGQTVTGTSTAFKAATNTQCGSLDVPRSKFPTNGTWSLTLSYTSASTSGEQKTTVKL